MMKSFLLTLFLWLMTSTAIAASVGYDTDRTTFVAEQNTLLADRVIQAEQELVRLQHQQHESTANKLMLNQTAWDISVAESNQNRVNIELSESEQTLNRLKQDIDDIHDQLNVSTIFGLKVARSHSVDMTQLESALDYRQHLWVLQKTHTTYLQQLLKIEENILRFNKSKYARIQTQLKSQTIMQLKTQQAQSEVGFQEQQAYWLQQLNVLYAKLNLPAADKVKVQDEIFYAEENANFTYFQMLISRYQDQLQQMKLSVSQSNSIILLNKMSEQTQTLSKQLLRLDGLLKNRINLLKQRDDNLLPAKEAKAELISLMNQYNIAISTSAILSREVTHFRYTLDQALQQELSSRQGLPGFSAKAWVDLGEEIVLVPPLAFEVAKNIAFTALNVFHATNGIGWTLLFFIETIWIGIFYCLARFFKKMVSGIPDHAADHINLKWLSIKLLHRSLLDVGVIGNLIGLFYFSDVSSENFNFIFNLGLVWISFKIFMTVARLCLVETVHDYAGHDVRLYYRLKWALSVGGVITACTVFFHQFPLMYELKDLFDRLFLLSLLIVSIFLIRSWEVVPNLISSYLDARYVFLRKTIRSLGLVIPLVLLVNSAIGLFGFVNLVLTISWYEGVFFLVLIGYLMIKSIFRNGMEWISKLFIQHVHNGWLWTEAFLKPMDKIFSILLFFSAWATLFLFYGWDQQSPIVEPFNKLLHYHLFNLLNTSITLLSIIELVVIIALFFWMARWTREFVYRLLLSRTEDLGLRNSVAIFSQYIVTLIGILTCLRVVGIDLRALTVVAGMFSLGIGLGLRDLANNFVCGFLLLIERPLRVGDMVSIDHHEGRVTHIGGRAVTVQTSDHMEVLIPNSDIFSQSFINWTAKDDVIRTVIAIRISRHDNPQAVQAILQRILLEQKDILKDPLPNVVLKELTEGLLEFEVHYFINLRQVKSRIDVRSKTLMAIWKTFEIEGIQPPYPHHEIHLKTDVSNVPALSRASALRLNTE